MSGPLRDLACFGKYPLASFLDVAEKTVKGGEILDQWGGGKIDQLRGS
jgi:hypothetical protein